MFFALSELAKFYLSKVNFMEVKCLSAYLEIRISFRFFPFLKPLFLFSWCPHILSTYLIVVLACILICLLCLNVVTLLKHYKRLELQKAGKQLKIKILLHFCQHQNASIAVYVLRFLISL